MDPRSSATKKKFPIHTRIFIGLVLGAVGGLLTSEIAGPHNPQVKSFLDNVTDPIGKLFLRLLLMIVIPLIFSSLVVGIAGIRDIRKLGRVGVKCFIYTFVISAISVVIGLTLANTISPGKRIPADTAHALQQRYQGDAYKKVEDTRKAAGGATPLMQIVATVVPSNPFSSIAAESPNMIHIMFFALMVGIAVNLLPQQASAPLVEVLDAVYRVSTKLIDIILQFAPFAVFCLLFNNTASFGTDLFGALIWFILTVLLGLAIHMFGVYSLSVAILSRISPIEFFRRIKTIMLTAFSTSSSNATLPTSLKITEENVGVPREINSFVLTVGATLNQNGTALYEGVTVLFIAQLAGVDLSLPQQIMVAYLAIFGGIGTAGVPAASIPFIILILSTIGINPELIGIILGIDRILDMCRTTLNVTGDITAATYVARSEGYTLLKMAVLPKNKYW